MGAAAPGDGVIDRGAMAASGNGVIDGSTKLAMVPNGVFLVPTGGEGMSSSASLDTSTSIGAAAAAASVQTGRRGDGWKFTFFFMGEGIPATARSRWCCELRFFTEAPNDRATAATSGQAGEDVGAGCVEY